MTKTTQYKNTAIGPIPTEWEVKKLEEVLINDRLGGNYDNSESNLGIPVIKMGNLDRGKISLDKIQYLPENVEYNKEDILKYGDLLFNTRNTLDLVGKVAIWKEELPFALYNSNLLKLEFKKEKVSSNFFMNYLFNSQRILSQLKGFATGTTSVAAIYSRDIKKLQIPLPPLPEQQKIAEILSTWDKAIQETDAIIKKLEERNKALAFSLLTGKKRVRGFENDVYRKTLANEVFKNVSIKNNSENLELLSATQEFGIIPRNLLEGRVTMPSGSLSTYKLVEKGDFVISLRSFQGGIEYSEYKGVVSPAYTVLKPLHQINDDFYKYYFKSTDLIGRLSVAVIGIRDGKNISYDDFSTITLPNPSIEEQNAIASILNTANDELKHYQQKLDVLKTQKKGLMQQLLTGKIRTV